MSETIWKFEVGQHATVQTIEMPKHSEIISVGIQNDVIMLWAIVNPTEMERELKTIFYVGTGRSMPNRTLYRTRRFIGTVQFNEPFAIVLHVFEVLK